MWSYTFKHKDGTTSGPYEEPTRDQARHSAGYWRQDQTFYGNRKVVRVTITGPNGQRG